MVKITEVNKKMNKEEALRKIEDLQKQTEKLQKFVKELDEKKEEDFCVVSHTNIEFHEGLKNLIFGNGCQIDSLVEGDGVSINKRFVKFIALNEEDNIEIVLKGSDKTKDEYDKILWDCDKEEKKDDDRI